ncbi:acyltransferase family protein [Phormidium tenue FACHB-886]|nr:acyltransferase family protein [Phormidium tenue FACHB-886]
MAQLDKASSKPIDRPERRYDWDGLRVLAVLLLIYFHTAAIFYNGELGEFYIRNAQTSAFMSGLVLFVHQWHMPLFFLLSGAGTGIALSFRAPQQYLYERSLRLLIPFVFGTLVLVPPLVYYHLLSNPSYHASYVQFYPQFFNGIRPAGNFEWGHLWFVIYLFVFSLLALPLFLHLRGTGTQWQAKLAALMEKPGGIFWLAVPLAIVEAALRPRWIGFQNLYDDWANFALYLLYFIYGYLICADPRFEQAIDRQLRTAIVLAAGCMLVLFGLWQTSSVPERGYSPEYVLYQAFRGFTAWCWIVAWLGLGRRYLKFDHKLLRYASEASYPVFLLHPTVLVAIGFYVMQWDISVAAKFAIISTASLIGTIALYELLVRRYNVMRFLFGLKPIRRQSTDLKPQDSVSA